MSKIGFYQLFGVTTPAAAAELWPVDVIQPAVGVITDDLDAGVLALMEYLQETLELTALRPGGSVDLAGLPTTGVVAALSIRNPPAPLRLPLVLTRLPEIAFYLEDSADLPAHLFTTDRVDEFGARHVDVVVHGLPVRIELPGGMITPLLTVAEQETGEPVERHLTEPFDPHHADSVQVTLRDTAPSYLKVRVDVRLTPAGDVYVDTKVPLSIGPCLFSGLPCRGLHDLQLIPSPAPAHVHAAHLDYELPLEWKRHRLDLGADNRGLFSIRSIDLDPALPPWDGLYERIRGDRGDADPVELVIEDAAFALVGSALPVLLPVHGRVSLRRAVMVGDATGEPYDLTSAPVQLPLGPLWIKLFRVLLQTTDLDGEWPIAFDATVVTDDDPDTAWAFPVSVDDQGVIFAGVVLPQQPTGDDPGPDARRRLFKLFGVHVYLAGAKLGLSMPEIREGGGFKDVVAALLDFELRDSDEKPPVAASGEAMVLHDVGWRFGKPALGGLFDSDSLQVKALDHLRIRVTEVGVDGSPDGGIYLVLSGGAEVPFGGPDTSGLSCIRPTAGREPLLEHGVGVYFDRMRSLLSRTSSENAPFSIDGVAVALRYSRMHLAAFGAIRDFTLPPGNRYQELALGAQVCFSAFDRTLDLAAQLFVGRVRGVDNFRYAMFSVALADLPLGSISLRDIRLLFAKNLAPQLEAPTGSDGHAQPMRLLRWYKDHATALELPAGRNLAAWAPRDSSLAAGAALSIAFGGCKDLRLGGFFFYLDSPEDAGWLAGLELYALKADKPIAYGAFEWDSRRSRWGLTLGIALTPRSLLGDRVPEWLDNLAAITGTAYFGNKPDTVAIGQYADPASWLSFRFEWKRFFDLSVLLAFCRHSVDSPDPSDPSQPNLAVTALAVSMKAAASLGVGKLRFYLAVTWVRGTWRNEALASGDVIGFEISLRIKLFGCFNFGASVQGEHSRLGPSDPDYKRTSAVIRIETPWYLPDVTLRYENVDGAPALEEQDVITLPLLAAAAFAAGPRQASPIGVASPFGAPGAGGVDGQALYSLAQLAAAPPVIVPASAFDALTPISCDSEIALDFKVAVDAEATVLPGTPGGASKQRAGDVAATYRLVEVGIRRRPRTGPNAGVWSDLIDPITTQLPSLPELEGGELSAIFASAARFAWDADAIRLNRLDPRRLLVNAETPYTLTSASPEADELIAAAHPGWPCCTPIDPKPRWHIVSWAAAVLGERAPGVQEFTESHSTLHWLGAPGSRPLVVPQSSAPAVQVARVELAPHLEGPVAHATFDELVYECQLFASWTPAQGTTNRLVVEIYRGLTRVDGVELLLSAAAPPQPIALRRALGFTSLLLRKVGRVESQTPASARLELSVVRYRSLAEARAVLAGQGRCLGQEQQVHGGRLAWLPNTDYEITLRTAAALSHPSIGGQEARIEQKAYFRTKGLPGLNATARLGEELEPYLESVYPARSPGGGPALLYRREPLILAMSERWNTFIPIDHTPSPGDPAERQQLLEWALAVDLLDGSGAMEPLSITSPDWIVAHRGTAPPPRTRGPVVLDGPIFTHTARQALSADPLKARLLRMTQRPGGCADPTGGLRASRVLSHQPYDPAAPEATVARWPAARQLRAALRVKSGPFIQRAPFVAEDVTALTAAASALPALPWKVEREVLALAQPGLAATTYYAVAGEPAWDHLLATARVDPGASSGSGEAGLAVGVVLSGARVTDALEAVVDGAARLLKLRVRVAGAITAEQSAPLPAALAAPFAVEVALFDDRCRATCGPVTVELARPARRGGKVAVLTRGGTGVHSLEVTALDGYRLTVHTSRYDDFPSHVASGSGVIPELPTLGAPTATPAQLVTETRAAVLSALAEGNAPACARWFTRWTEALALPLRREPAAVELSRLGASVEAAALWLLESPEPLPIGRDVQALLARRGAATWPGDPVDPSDLGAGWLTSIDVVGASGLAPSTPPDMHPTAVVVRREPGARDAYAYALADGDPRRLRRLRRLLATEAAPWLVAAGALAAGSCVALDAAKQPVHPVVPLPTFAWIPVPLLPVPDGPSQRVLIVPLSGSAHAPQPRGMYRLELTLDRVRYRSATTDAANVYHARHVLQLGW